MGSSSVCSCGRQQTELGCDLCAICRAEYEERQYHRAQEAGYHAKQQDEYEAWLNEQGPPS